MPKFHIPSSLYKYSHEQELVFHSSTFLELVEDLKISFPELALYLFDEAGAVRSFIIIYINSVDIRFLNWQEVKMCESDVITIVSALAGG